MKVLLVEDSATLRYAMSGYVTSADHEVVFANTGEEAVQIVETNPVDLIFMDVQMPGLDGFETTRLIREILGNFWVPIVFITGDENDSSYETGIAAGGDDYLIKPVSKIIVKAKIRAMERIVAMRNQLTDLNKELLEVSQRDSLTALYNRRTFDEKAMQQWRLCARNKDPLAVLLLDIDHFKLYNDTYGHPAGDECIKQVVQVLQGCISRPDDILARYGGEEFIAFLPHTSLDGVKHICEELKNTLSQSNIRHRTSTTSDRVTISIGVSILNFTTGTSLLEQIRNADQALYQSKSKGRDCATFKIFRTHRKLLVIDNDASNQRRVKLALEGHCTVSGCTYQEDGLVHMLRHKPDVMLLDIDGFDSDGMRFVEHINRAPDLPLIPTIIMSELETEELSAVAKKLGVHSQICKPIDEHILIDKVNDLLT